MSRLRKLTAGLVLAGLLMQIVAAPGAGATPPPKRPHPHRKPWPITITIQTVPKLVGVRLSFDGIDLVTNADGRATHTEEHNFRAHVVSLVDPAVTMRNRRYRFVRWAGQRDPNQAFRRTVSGLPMRANYTMIAAFSVQVPVSVRFVDQSGSPIDPDRVSVATARSSTGGVVRLPTTGTVWLDGLVPVYRNSRMQNQVSNYSLTSVMIGGANTVDSGQQRFQPVSDPHPTFTTKFFDLTVRAHDVLLKRQVGTGARVTFPDGTRRLIPFGADGTATLRALPRGRYVVDLASGSGTAIPRDFVLSRNSVVDLPVGTRSDYAIIVIALLIMSVGLLLVGRARRPLGSMVVRLLQRRRGALLE